MNELITILLQAGRQLYIMYEIALNLNVFAKCFLGCSLKMKAYLDILGSSFRFLFSQA